MLLTAELLSSPGLLPAFCLLSKYSLSLEGVGEGSTNDADSLLQKALKKGT